MAAWAVTAIRERHPDARIVWAAETRCIPVIETARLVDEVVEIPRERWKRRGLSGVFDSIRLYRSLRRHEFDLGLDFQGHSKTALCLRLAAPTIRASARATDAFARCLNPIPRLTPRSPHEVDLNLALVQTILDGVLEADKPIMPSTMPSDCLPPFESERLVTIQTGAGASDKVVAASTWCRVAEALLAEGWMVAAIGGPGDPRVPHPAVVDWVGQLDLRQAMSVVAHSRLHLAGDTGTGHIAAAYGVPVISIFGPTPVDRYRPWGGTATVLTHGRSTDSVGVEEIVDAARNILSVSRASCGS